MSDLREQIEKAVDKAWCEQPFSVPHTADTILALIPKPTVRVKCGECDGEGNYDDAPDGSCSEHMVTCPYCTDGGNEHEIVWESNHDKCNGDGWLEDNTKRCNCDDGLISRTLTLPDLIGPDVRTALACLELDSSLAYISQPVPHNKGTLRIVEVVK